MSKKSSSYSSSQKNASDKDVPEFEIDELLFSQSSVKKRVTTIKEYEEKYEREKDSSSKSEEMNLLTPKTTYSEPEVRLEALKNASANF